MKNETEEYDGILSIIGKEGFSQMIDESIENFNYWKALEVLESLGEENFYFSTPRRIKRELTLFLLTFEKEVHKRNEWFNFKNEYFEIHWDTWDLKDGKKGFFCIPYFTVLFRKGGACSCSYMVDAVECYESLFSMVKLEKGIFDK